MDTFEQEQADKTALTRYKDINVLDFTQGFLPPEEPPHCPNCADRKAKPRHIWEVVDNKGTAHCADTIDQTLCGLPTASDWWWAL